LQLPFWSHTLLYLLEDQRGSIQILVIAQRFCIDDERLEDTKWLHDGCYSVLRYKYVYIALETWRLLLLPFLHISYASFVKGIVLENPFLELSVFYSFSFKFCNKKGGGGKLPLGCFVSERKVLPQLA
jgi:hypothetical protein